ncbi:MAG: PqqD family protein [Flavobacteriales bacterium]|jgi:hypothetical protein|nr:PqqD family protein [Flavobacteriales bacterium]MBR4402096.1 PqqD family protein [Flavobacteriales bacterium]
MKIKSEYKLREIAGEVIIVNQGTVGIDMTRIISLNDSARELYEHLVDKDFTLDDAAGVLVDIYDIPLLQAQRDAEVWIDALKKCGVIE